MLVIVSFVQAPRPVKFVKMDILFLETTAYNAQSLDANLVLPPIFAKAAILVILLILAMVLVHQLDVCIHVLLV